MKSIQIISFPTDGDTVTKDMRNYDLNVQTGDVFVLTDGDERKEATVDKIDGTLVSFVFNV